METELVKTDVIIVGAGPTGLSLAVQLVRYGIDFVIFDKKDGTTDLSKALVVHSRTLEIFDQIGLAEIAVGQSEIVEKVVLLHNGETTAQIDFSDWGKDLSPFPFLLMFEQSKNERLLDEYLQKSGREVLWQTELESFSQDAGGVTAQVKNADGTIQTIEAQYLVGCDGAGSKTRHLLDLHFEGSTYPRLFYVADVEMEFEAEQATVFASFGKEAIVLFFPMQGAKRWRIIGNLPEYDREEKPEIPYETIEAKVQKEIRRPLDITKVNWFSTYKVHTRHVEAFGRGRCFLAGDAAHVHTPTGGQGMNTGIQDAYNLAWKLALVLKGEAALNLLETYNEERLPNAKRLVETTDQAFDVVVGNHWYVRFLRDALIPAAAKIIAHFDAAKEFIFPTISQIGINYRESSLSRNAVNSSFSVKAGDRMPYFLIDGANVFARLNASKFHLVIFSDGSENYDKFQADIKNRFDDRLDINLIPLIPKAAEIFGAEKSFFVLLRPDNYIGLISDKISAAEIKRYFNDIYFTKTVSSD